MVFKTNGYQTYVKQKHCPIQKKYFCQKLLLGFQMERLHGTGTAVCWKGIFKLLTNSHHTYYTPY